MKVSYLVFSSLFVLLLAGCAKERVYENMYQGMKNREQIVHPADAPIPQERQSYQAYKREREKSLQDAESQ
jgi:uncharacterized lipoprotein